MGCTSPAKSQRFSGSDRSTSIDQTGGPRNGFGSNTPSTHVARASGSGSKAPVDGTEVGWSVGQDPLARLAVLVPHREAERDLVVVIGGLEPKPGQPPNARRAARSRRLVCFVGASKYCQTME